MRKLMAKLLVCSSLLLPLQLATPATAGQGTWTTSACRPDVYWINYDGYYGTEYWTVGYPDTTDYYFWVDGRRMNAYQNWGYQCGTLGAPTSDLFQNYVQWFENGAIKWEPGNFYQPNGCWYVFYGVNQTKDWACY